MSGDEQVHKPDPEIFRRAAARLGVGCANCAYVGDHLVNDIQALPRQVCGPSISTPLGRPGDPGNVTEIHSLSELLDIFP